MGYHGQLRNDPGVGEKFGPQIAKRVRAARVHVSDKWYLDEAVILIGEVKH